MELYWLLIEDCLDSRLGVDNVTADGGINLRHVSRKADSSEFIRLRNSLCVVVKDKSSEVIPVVNYIGTDSPGRALW
jgi:hypothetical protein